ncbi:MAG: 4-hydroxybenzoyl-CoA reductase subunit alpha, partial [Myxococcota bacterium]
MGPKDNHSGQVAEGGIVGGGGRGKIDGLPKIIGTAKFTDDLKLPRMVHAKVLRSPHAHAKILSIDTTDALAMEGVLAVLTGEDVPITYGAIPVAQDETALALGKVRYIGEPVAAVAALTPAIAWEAARKIHVMYEP